jgi:hypothetical protein
MAKPIEIQKVKNYPLPDEVISLFVDAEAMLGLRDQYAKQDFGYRKAKKCAKGSNKLFTKFWRMTMQIYPELNGKPLIVNKVAKSVIVRPMPNQMNIPGMVHK